MKTRERERMQKKKTNGKFCNNCNMNKTQVVFFLNNQ